MSASLNTPTARRDGNQHTVSRFQNGILTGRRGASPGYKRCRRFTLLSCFLHFLWPFAHSMGSLVALKLALEHPEVVSNLILIGPPPNPLPEAGVHASHKRAFLVRNQGMLAVVDAIIQAGSSAHVQQHNPLAVAAVRISLLGQDAEGYAKACAALAGSASEILDISSLKIPVSFVTGEDDKVSPPTLCQKYSEATGGGHVEVLKNVGHWHLFEDPDRTVSAVSAQLYLPRSLFSFFCGIYTNKKMFTGGQSPSMDSKI